MNYGKLTAGTTKTAIDTAKPSEKGEIITYLSRMGDVLHNIQKRSKVIIRSVVTVNTVVNCKETDIFLWKQNFRIKTYLQIISPQSAHILNNQGFYISCFNFFYQRLKARVIEIYTRKSVIGKMANVLKTIPTGIIFEVFLLIGNRITLASKVIIS